VPRPIAPAPVPAPVPVPVPVPEPEVVASAGGEKEEPMDLESPAYTFCTYPGGGTDPTGRRSSSACCTCAYTARVYRFSADFSAPTGCPKDGMDLQEQVYGC